MITAGQAEVDAAQKALTDAQNNLVNIDSLPQAAVSRTSKRLW